MKKTNLTSTTKIMNRAGQKAAHKGSFLDRVMDSGAKYMSSFAVVRGNMPSTNSSFFLF